MGSSPITLSGLSMSTRSKSPTYPLSIILGKLERPHCDLTGLKVSKGNQPKIALVQISELLQFTQVIGDIHHPGIQSIIHEIYEDHWLCRAGWKGGSKQQELSAADGSVQTIHPFLQPLLHTLHWWYPNVQSQKLEWLD